MSVDPGCGRRDPAGEFSRLDHEAHERSDEGAIGAGRQPFCGMGVPLGLGNHLAVRRNAHGGKGADAPVERLVRRKSRNWTPVFSMRLFQRSTPFAESRMKSSRSTSFSAFSIGTARLEAPSFTSRIS